MTRNNDNSENWRKMGCHQRQLVCTLVWAILISLLICSADVSGSLPNSCSVLTYPSTLQVDVICTDELPDFSRANFPHTQYVYELVLSECAYGAVNFSKNSFLGLTGVHHIYMNCESSRTSPEMRFKEGVFDDLPKLSMLVITGNRFMDLPNDIFCNLPSLTKLYIGNNSISLSERLGFGTNCSSSYCNNSVELIKLSENSITHLPNRTFCSLTKLKYLDLSQNGLRSIEEDAFYNLESVTFLDLSHNKLTSLPENTLKPLINMYSLDLASNLNLNISGFLKYVPRLKGLYLPGIGIEFLEKDSFHGLHRVESLMLYDNRLQTVHEDVFEPLIGFDDVGNNTALHECEEDAIDRLTFGGFYHELDELYSEVVAVTGLRYLNLDGNKFTAMPPIRKLFKLLVFSISKNQIDVVDDNTFEKMKQLQRLTLSYNRIQFISHLVFANLKCLKQLLLDHNGISYINSTAFHGLSALSELNLQHNRIKDISGLFVKNENLKKLNLSNNLIVELSLEMLPPSIVVLDVSHNSIKHLVYSSGSLSKQFSMMSLNLSYNQISAINKNFFPTSLTELLLNDNMIKNVSNCMYCNMGSIIKVTMHNNQLQTIHPEDLKLYSLSAFQKTPFVSLSGNDFICNCDLQEISYFHFNQGYLQIQDWLSLICHREYSKNKPARILLVQAVATEDFLCKIGHQNNATIPETCSVYHNINWVYIIVDCSAGNLTLIPPKVYPGVVKLYLDGNNFSKLKNNVFQVHVHQNLSELYLNNSNVELIEDNTFIELVKLRHLHLQNNNLKYLTTNSFAGLQQLIELRLSYNKLMTMEDKVFYPLPELRRLHLNNNHLSLFPVWELRNSKSLSAISLAQNPWSCDCDFVHKYREWLQDRASAVIDLDSLFCKFDNNSASGAPLIAFNVSHCFSLTESSFLKSDHFPLLLGLLSGLLLFSVACIILYVCRKEMQVWIYTRYGVRIFHKNDAKKFDDEKVYDAFICYSNSDEDFVVDQLLPNLEGIEPPFRCCIHQRDFLVGGYITDNILEAVSKSRRSILVLSETFISSEWCRFEFKTAYVQMLKDKCNRVIVIVVGEIPKQLDPEMKLYLKTNTYITWGEKLFWERLYFSMPDRLQT